MRKHGRIMGDAREYIRYSYHIWRSLVYRIAELIVSGLENDRSHLISKNVISDAGNLGSSFGAQFCFMALNIYPLPACRPPFPMGEGLG